ncbi:MAG TPA: thioredoxin family protein [Methylomirabilota bacterium]|nr:thioredoxin family protein [Methylomirabilota bacterium]
MKKIVIALLVCFALLRVSAADLNWLTDLPKAQAQAKIENKLVLLDFTGSDWCGWCKKLDAETFSKSEFADYAVKNLVLVQLDYPNKKPQSDDLKKANAALQKI